MGEIQQLTKYEEFADSIGIIDKHTFLKNISILANCNESYRSILEDLINLSNTYVDIEPNIEYNEWYNQIVSIYRLSGGIGFVPLYCLICEYTGKPIQKYLDYEEEKRVVYDFYINNYQEFIKLIKKVLTPEGKQKWFSKFPKQKVEKVERDNTEIPIVPLVPDI